MATKAVSKKKIVYYYDEEVGNFYYGQSHPMKPHRIRMTHSLIVNYGLFKKMEVYRPYRLDERDMTLFHADDYCHFLKTVTVENECAWGTDLEKFNIDVDCPVFDGVYRFCQISSGGSVGGAYKLNHKLSDISINWAGGLHHAKKSEASGFCYINDIVLAILELLKFHPRVLYIDIDIHHGDGVEEAFYTTDRVMTVSFHKYGDFFPGTGAIEDCGVLKGKYYSLNVPLKEGINDASYEYLFKPIIDKIINYYQPAAIVMQMGADSLAGDRLGCFNMTIAGHGECLSYVQSFGLPLLVLGGGGYTLRNVARCWTYETSICCDTKLKDKIPYNEYYEYFAPDYTLSSLPTNMVNINTKNDLQKILFQIDFYLKQLPSSSPSVPINPDSNREEYALRAGTKEFQKQVNKANNIINKFVNNENKKNNVIVHKDDVLQSKEEINQYLEDKAMDNNNDNNINDEPRIPQIFKDKLIVDNREFYENDKDQDQNGNDAHLNQKEMKTNAEIIENNENNNKIQKNNDKKTDKMELDENENENENKNENETKNKIIEENKNKIENDDKPETNHNNENDENLTTNIIEEELNKDDNKLTENTEKNDEMQVDEKPNNEATKTSSNIINVGTSLDK